jgi:hypothetical protein
MDPSYARKEADTSPFIGPLRVHLQANRMKLEQRYIVFDRFYQTVHAAA